MSTLGLNAPSPETPMQTALIIIFVVLAVLRFLPIAAAIVDGIASAVRFVVDSLRLLAFALAAGVISLPVIILPSDLPQHNRPWAMLDLDAEPGRFDRWKVRAMSFDQAMCRDAMVASRAQVRLLPDRVQSNQCHIRGRTQIRRLSQARLAPVDTKCSIAARLYLWERQILQPAAQELLGARVARISHFSSFSCRPMRTSRGTSTRMSQHATANAFDISGFVLSDGRHITLQKHWNGSAAEAKFLRRARDGLCSWFNVTLSPDFNALHADHFHVDMGPFLSCR